jgi:uncharacterized damage-inducible protein DinB
MNAPKTRDRRNFIKTSVALTSGFAAMSILPATGYGMPGPPGEGIHIIGPREGFSPQIGILVSMMNWMRQMVLSSVKGMSVEQLDYLHDPHANTIGAMLLHLAATDAFYQGNTFEGLRDYTEAGKMKWGAAMNLGDEGRKQIRGNNLNYYTDMLTETREVTLAKFKQLDDKWLMTVDDKFFGGQPTNNYCKWFHVCEHESNHNGQIKWIKSRIPGAKDNKE